MKYEQFLKQVQTVAQLTDRAEAERATQATLEVLKQRVVGDEAKDLASQLPKELQEYLRGREGLQGETFSLQEFYQRIADHADLSPETVPIQARAVITVIQAAVTPGEFRDLKANFSEDYADLFATPMDQLPAVNG